MPFSQKHVEPGHRRTHLIHEICSTPTDTALRLCGWISHIRWVGCHLLLRLRVVSSTLVFIVLRDHTGTVQLLLDPKYVPDFPSIIKSINSTNGVESTISIGGILKKRPEKMNNTQMTTGAYEVLVEDFVVLNPATHVPFNPHHLPLVSCRALLCNTLTFSRTKSSVCEIVSLIYAGSKCRITFVCEP